MGCFNAGIPAYFGSRTVVNLDGLMNHAVIPYWRGHRFLDYLRDAHLAWIAGEEGAFGRAINFSAAARPMVAVPVATAPLTGWPTPWRVLWKMEEPPPDTARKE